MRKKLDLTNKRFGKLVAIKIDGKNNCGKTMWLCKCDCGNYKSIDIHSLLRKDKTPTTTCGKCKKSMKGKKCYKHGMSGTRLYHCYKLMKNRCYNQNDKSYYIYGGRGIKICKDWLGDNGALNFINWALNNGYKDDLTIDRIDNNKGYSPDNCRWTTRKEQSNNLRCNKHYEYKNKLYTLTQLCELLNLDKRLIYSRLRCGWNLDKAINTPKHKNGERDGI